MEQRTIEGPWEDIARRAAEFEGHFVRITILDEPAPVTLDHALGDILKDADRLVETLPPSSPSSTDDGMASVAEKYRRQGFDL